MDDDGPRVGEDLDLRLVRSFTVVAEHRHFGRAAAAQHVAQPALSRRVRRLERHLGAVLFTRDSRGTGLTAAGEAFLPHALALLESARTAETVARAAATPAQITIGHVAALLITPAVRALRAQRPDAEVRTVHLDWHEPRPALLEHRIDVAVARLPFPTDGLRVQRLRDEPRVLLVARDHRLATRASVRLADIADEPLSRLAGADPVWASFWRVDPRPDGRPAPLGPVVDRPEDRLEAVAGGGVVALATTGVLDGHLRPDLAAIPVEDVDPVPVVLASRTGDRSDLVAEFLRLAATRLVDGDGPAGPGAPGDTGSAVPPTLRARPS